MALRRKTIVSALVAILLIALAFVAGRASAPIYVTFGPVSCVERDICSGYGTSTEDNRLGPGSHTPDSARVRRGSPNRSDGDGDNHDGSDDNDGTGSFPDRKSTRLN